MVLELKEYTMASLGYKSSENPLNSPNQTQPYSSSLPQNRRTPPPFLHLLHFLTSDFSPSLADRRRAAALAPPPPPSNHSSFLTSPPHSLLSSSPNSSLLPSVSTDSPATKEGDGDGGAAYRSCFSSLFSCLA